ncbi:MAG: hypothetical protein M1813_000714 [Trichoglossum hirsutum]|nr:MAG: hypothetical protein M1813_000714 [Trichoglossum hirsutum]
MLPYKQLQPAGLPVMPPQQVNRSQHGIQKTRNRYLIQDWENRKPQIVQYYSVEGRTLNETMVAIEEQTGFKARQVFERTWKKMIKIWGLDKNITEAVKLAILRKKVKRRNEGKETEFFFRSAPVKQERIQRFEQQLNKRKLFRPTEHLSPETSTPEGVEYSTPKSYHTLPADIDHEGLNRSSCGESDNQFIRLMTTRGESIVQFIKVEQWHGSHQRYTEKALLRKIYDHHHQMRVQELDSSGRFSEREYPRQLLRRARNLGIDLNEAIHESQGYACEEGTQISTEAPEYFLKGNNRQSLEAFMDCIIQNRFCHELLGLKVPSLHRWKQKWKLMNKDAGFDLDRLACRIFGDLAVPYPDMSVSYFYVRFNPDQVTQNSTLLRITFGVDLRSEVQECQYCQPAFMALDLISAEGTVKAHIPLAHSGTERRCKSEEEYNSIFLTTTWISLGNLISRAVSHQGWSYKTCCHQQNADYCVFEKEAEEWDPNGAVEQDKPFQPFPPDRDVHSCTNTTLSKEILEFHEIEEWDPAGTLN